VSISPDATQLNGWAVGESGLILHYRRQATSIARAAGPLPVQCVLDQNYPNPFNPSTTISYVLPTRTRVKLMVYNALGQHVAALVDEIQEAGTHSVKFSGNGYASGVYIYRLFAGDNVQSRRLVYLK
jgi:hypothetical protein